MNNYLNMIVAGQPVKAAHPAAWPVLLDENGNIAEGSGSDLFIVQDGALRTPRQRYVLPGVSRRMTMDLAAKLGAPAPKPTSTCSMRRMREVFLVATSLCILPVRWFNGATVGHEDWGGAGPVTQRLIDAYAAEANCDFAQQYLSRLPG